MSLMKSVFTVSVVAWIVDRSDFLANCIPSARALLAVATLFLNLRRTRYSSPDKKVLSLVWKLGSKNQSFSRGAVSGVYTRDQSWLMNLPTSPQRKGMHHVYIEDSQRSWSHLETKTDARLRTMTKCPYLVRTYLQSLTSLLKNSSLTTKKLVANQGPLEALYLKQESH